MILSIKSLADRTIMRPIKQPTRRLSSTSSTNCTLFILILSTLVLQMRVANSATPNATTTTTSVASNSTNTTNSTSKTSSPSKTSQAGVKSAPSSSSVAPEQQQLQSTDVSSMYVQIPFAEPNDAASDGVQQTLSSTDETQNSDGQKSSSWTEARPKKFQIGYIKQSDLHQVLIESLKGEPFSGSKATSPATAPNAGKTSQVAAPIVQKWPATITNNHQRGPSSIRQHPQHQPQQNRPLHHPGMMNSFRGESLRANRHPMGGGNGHGDFHSNRFAMEHPQVPRLHHMQPHGHNMQQLAHQQMMLNFNPMPAQLQFGAGFMGNMLKNQPMYQTMAADHDAMQHNSFMSNHMMGQNRPQKSMEYFTSWKPVTNGNEIPSSKTSPQSDVSNLPSDGFDDGFTAPTKEYSGSSMNRHPALNSYLNSEQANPGKMSPAMINVLKMRKKDSTSGGKVASNFKWESQSKDSGTKTVARDLSGTKSGGNTTASSGDRKATTNDDGTNSTTTTTTPSSVTESTVGSAANLTTTSTTSTTANPVETETTDPDSEVVTSNGGEDSSEQTTTQSSITTTSVGDVDSSTVGASPAGSTEPTSATTTPASGNQTDDSSEVATQPSAGASPGTASLPSVGDDSTDSSASKSSSREETTPATEMAGSPEADSASKKSASAEPMSDEALLEAAVKTGTEIAKKSQNQRTSSTSARKVQRSSERLTQQSTSKTANQSIKSMSQLNGNGSGNPGKTSGAKSAAQKSAAPGANRAAKQVAMTETKTSKGKSSSSSSSKSSGLKSAKAKGKANKTTRMAGEEKSQKLQQVTQVVSMTAAQAQSTAQTLASLLLSRCLSSTNCAHLLDICTTKMATVPMNSNSTVDGSGNELAASWSMPIGLMSSNLMSLTQALQADKVLKMFPQWKEAAENVMDQGSQSGYTLILPSNEAVERLASSTLESWMANPELLNQIIDNHILDSSEVIEFSANNGGQRAQQTRFIRSKNLQVNEYRDRMVTINGKRLVYANQLAPAGGRIQVIDGVFDLPVSSGSSASAGNIRQQLDIMDTLKLCDKYDGFKTLVEGTGLDQILRQDGPMTVFVPSNEALRKIPDEELEVIRNNQTALKEFLMYHVVNGSYFSQDLRDGQQLASILDKRPIQVGVRVDGCSRRLVEANTSPMRRADIVAKNGVIHILDWYLTTRDNDWCDSSSQRQQGNQLQASSSNQQLVSLSSTSGAVYKTPAHQEMDRLVPETSANYATRVAIPSNHKPLPTQSNGSDASATLKGSPSSSIVALSS